MDGRQFDALVRRLGSRVNRRETLRAMVAGTAALVVGGAVADGEVDARCGAAGVRCNRSAACCSGACTWTTVTRGRRKIRVGTCASSGLDHCDPCQQGDTCPNGSCCDGLCRWSDGASCSDDTDCCSGACYGGTCIAKGTDGTPCNSNGDCASDYCNMNYRICATQVAPGGACNGTTLACQENSGKMCCGSTCLASYQQPCSIDADCCTGYCYSGTCGII